MRFRGRPYDALANRLSADICQNLVRVGEAKRTDRGGRIGNFSALFGAGIDLIRSELHAWNLPNVPAKSADNVDYRAPNCR